jgi:hypothetical protein
MGTKQNPGEFDCYANALPDEPMFVLLARDPDFHWTVMEWALRCEQEIYRGERPQSDMAMISEAINCAKIGAKWRLENDGKWRKKPGAVDKRSSLIALKSRIDIRLDNRLCEMQEGWDGSICGFNEAWDIVRAAFDEELPKEAVRRGTSEAPTPKDVATD